METNEIKVKQEVDRARAVEYLEDVVKSLKSGELCIAHGDESAVLTPADTVRVEVKAKSKSDKESITIKIAWHLEEQADEEDEQEGALSISSNHKDRPAGKQHN